MDTFKKIINSIGTRIYMPFCFFIVGYLVFDSFFSTLSFITPLRYLLAFACVLVVLYGIFGINVSSDKSVYNEIKKIKTNNNISLKVKLYLISGDIIGYIFVIYFLLYAIGGLYNKSVIFNYLIILLLGVYYGFRVAWKRDYYKRNNSL